MPDVPNVSPEVLRAAAVKIREEEALLESVKTELYQRELAIKAERHEINERQNDLVIARHALEYKAGEHERMGSPEAPSDAVFALIESAVAAASSAPGAAAVEAAQA